MAKRKKRLSAAEVFIVAGVLFMILSAIVPVIWTYRINMVERMIREDFRQVEGGVKYFFMHYNRMPTELEVSYDFRLGLPDDLPNRQLMNALRAIDGEGNEGHEVNPEQNAFSKFTYAGSNKSGIAANGDLIDPWGRPYQVVLDLDGNRICDLVGSIYDRAFGKQVAIWSYGADGRANTQDDILSWVK